MATRKEVSTETEKAPVKESPEPANGQVGQLVPRQAPGNGLVPIWEYRCGEGMAVCSLDLSTEKNRIAAYRADKLCTADLADMVDKPIDVVGFLVRDATGINMETGEQQTWPRTVLLLADGTSLATGSDQIPDCLRSLCAVFGPAPWNPPKKLVLRAPKSEKKRTYFIFDIAE